MTRLPQAASTVVIGGGAMGLSTAYHLAASGQEDVVLIERAKLTSGTTWHAAGLVRQLRSSANLTQLIRNSVALYRGLEAETGQATGWLQTGSLSIATTEDRHIHNRRQASLASAYGVRAEVIELGEAKRLWPLMRTDDLVGAVYSPEDGRVNPSDLALALAKGARARGVKIVEGVCVTGFEQRNGHIHAVLTEHGRIECEAVALCAGLWSRDVAALAGVSVPLCACQHFYLLTEPIDGLGRHLPTLGDHDHYLYIRDEVGGLLVGCFEPNALLLPKGSLPERFEFDLLNEDWDHFEPALRNAIHRLPVLETVGARQLLNGPESFTLDGHFMLGESPNVDGFFVGAGMNSVGVASAGGAGRALAEWIVGGEPPMDLWEVDVRRFAPFQDNLRALEARIPESLSLHYALAYPGRQHETVRGLRRLALHERYAAKGAHFGQRAGWERPEWFAPEGEHCAGLTFGKPPWLGHVAAEHRAARESAALIDQSPFGKLLVQGPDAGRALERLCANRIDVAPGRLVYTTMLNRNGGIETDVVVQRLDEASFLVVTGAAQLTRDRAWITRHTDPALRVVFTDVTSAWSVLGLAGPRAQSVLERVTSADLSDPAFSYYRWREIELGCAKVRAARLSYTGEHGYELYIPVEFTSHVYEVLTEAGLDLGLRDIGTLALASLRIEKGFRAWGADLSSDTSPFEAGLGATVKMDKPGGFIGREALLRQRERSSSKRLLAFVLDDPHAYPLGQEPIVFDDEVVGQITSAAFGHTLGRGVALGLVRGDERALESMLERGALQIEIAGRRWAASATLNAPLDSLERARAPSDDEDAKTAMRGSPVAERAVAER